MRRTIAFILLLVFLDASPASRQLFKLPLLLVHYHDHRHENPGISFWQYLKLHYHGENDNGKDEAEDQQLPFKSAADGAGPVFIFTAKVQTTEIIIPFIEHRTGHPDEDLLPGMPLGVFHPPKLS